MASHHLSLKEFLEGLTGKPTILLAYVHRQGQDETSYLIGDESATALMTFFKNPSFGKNVKPGSFLKLINPILEQKTVVLQSAPLQSRPIKYKALDKCDVPLEPVAGTSASGLHLTFDDINKLPVGSNVTNFVSKVTHLSPMKKASGGSGSPYKTAKVRDVKGQRHVIQLWGGHSEGVEEDKVYSFKTTKVGNFRPAQDSPYWLSTRPNSLIEEAEKDLSSKFDGIVEWEGSCQGILFGHEKPTYYTACPSCYRSVQEDDATCKNERCKKRLDDKLKDFCVVLMIQDEEDESVFHRVLVWRRQLQLDTSGMGEKWQELVDEELEKLTFKPCKAFYNNPSMGEDETIKKLYKIEFA